MGYVREPTGGILRKVTPINRGSSLLSQRSMEGVLSPDALDPPKGVEWGRSESQQEEYYGKLLP